MAKWFSADAKARQDAKNALIDEANSLKIPCSYKFDAMDRLAFLDMPSKTQTQIDAIVANLKIKYPAAFEDQDGKVT